MKLGLLVTVILGVIFSRGARPMNIGDHAAFEFAGGIYGANFFMATGFHGAARDHRHALFLIICLLRVDARPFQRPSSISGFEAAAWYWHFVDVVWLFLFVCIYVWGAGTPAAH